MKKVLMGVPGSMFSHSNAAVSACGGQAPVDDNPQALCLCPREYIDARWDQAPENVCAFNGRNTSEYLY